MDLDDSAGLGEVTELSGFRVYHDPATRRTNVIGSLRRIQRHLSGAICRGPFVGRREESGSNTKLPVERRGTAQAAPALCV
jgi:hypothetical protein